jgi:hypothetical protein
MLGSGKPTAQGRASAEAVKICNQCSLERAEGGAMSGQSERYPGMEAVGWFNPRNPLSDEAGDRLPNLPSFSPQNMLLLHAG